MAPTAKAKRTVDPASAIPWPRATNIQEVSVSPVTLAQNIACGMPRAVPSRYVVAHRKGAKRFGRDRKLVSPAERNPLPRPYSTPDRNEVVLLAKKTFAK